MTRAYRSEGTSQKTKLTERLIANAKPLLRGEIPERRLLLDTEQRGFGMAVNASGSKSYFVLRRVAGKQVRYKFKNVGECTLVEARREAATLLGQMSSGVDPIAERRRVIEESKRKKVRGFTLREAMALAFDTMRARGRSEGTIAGYEGQMNLYLSGWLDRPLADLTRGEVRARHQALAAEIARGKYVLKGTKGRGRRRVTGSGRVTANSTFRTFRMIWNRALREHPELPPNPTINVDWFPQPPHKAALTPEGLRDWFKAVERIESGVRRDYLLFALFSGMRRRSVAEMRWDQVDFERRALRVPRPKGGEARAFDLPLSDYLIKILEGRLAEQQKLVGSDRKELPWVWPAASKTGHIAEPREDGLPGTIHDLRRVFITVATHRLKLHPYDVKLLVNHVLPREDVTTHYVAPDLEALRAPMQSITNALRTFCGVKRRGRK